MNRALAHICPNIRIANNFWNKKLVNNFFLCCLLARRAESAPNEETASNQKPKTDVKCSMMSLYGLSNR